MNAKRSASRWKRNTSTSSGSFREITHTRNRPSTGPASAEVANATAAAKRAPANRHAARHARCRCTTAPAATFLPLCMFAERAMTLTKSRDQRRLYLRVSICHARATGPKKPRAGRTRSRPRESLPWKSTKPVRSRKACGRVRRREAERTGTGTQPTRKHNVVEKRLFGRLPRLTATPRQQTIPPAAGRATTARRARRR